MPWSVRMVLLIAAGGSLFHLFVARRLVTALASITGWPRRRLRLSIAVAVVYLILYPLVTLGAYSFGFAGTLQKYEALVDAALTYPFWVGIIVSVQLALIWLLADVVRLIFYPLYRKNKAQWVNIQSRLVVMLACGLVVFVVARVYNDTATVRVRQTEFLVRDLPNELDGLRIVHSGDIQVDSRTNGAKLEAYVKAVNELQPDLILFCGDLVTSGTRYIDQGAAAMARMSSTYGTYACLGDHDYFSDKQLVSRALSENGVKLLDDATTGVIVGSSLVAITGITNVYRMRAVESSLEDIEKRRPPAPLSIFLTHQPSEPLVKFAAERRYDLFLAGHTHGGQIVLPLPGILITGSTLETRYVSGFEQVGSMLVSVTNGLGLTLAPIRYNAPAEVTMIRIRRATPAGGE